jgi:YfiH family protein
MLNSTKPEPIRAPWLERTDGIRHGFFTRIGGVSQGSEYGGLNTGIGSSDDPAAVHENRRRVADAIGLPQDRLVAPFQVHSADVVVVDRPFEGERPKADGIVTATPYLAIAVVTADCGPVLFADPHARVVAAAHAGWPGARAGVLENTIEQMIALGSRRDRITAVLGPSISQANYEVGPEFHERFVGDTDRNRSYFAASGKPDHYMFDLAGYTLDRLIHAGITARSVGRCTYADEDLFYSYRRTTHCGEADYGRQISVIALEDI